MNWYAALKKIAMPFGPSPDYFRSWLDIGHREYVEDSARRQPEKDHTAILNRYKDRPEAKTMLWIIERDGDTKALMFRADDATHQGHNGLWQHEDMMWYGKGETVARGRFEINNKNPEGVSTVQINNLVTMNEFQQAALKKQVERMLDAQLAKLNGGKVPLLIFSA